MIIAVVYATFAVAKRKPEKNSGLYGIRTLDLCDTGTALYQLRWLDTVFQGQHLLSLSINYVAINKVLKKLTPQLY